MPSPFSSKKTQTDETKANGTVPVVNSQLACQYCFAFSDEGTYYPESSRLVWDCDGCGKTNIVKDIKI